jgi:signal peptidase II
MKALQLVKNKYGILSLVGVISLVLDQWTKWMVHSSFRVGESVSLLDPVLALTYVRNKGAAFGILQTANPAFRDPFFMLVPLVAISVISYLYFKLEQGQRLAAFALSLVLSGAIGNLIDRVRLSYVIDFVDVHWYEVYHWPAFNVADSCIVVGVCILFVQSFRQPTPARN